MKTMTRIGVSRRRRPVKDYDELLALPTREREDDGLCAMAGGHAPECPDCLDRAAQARANASRLPRRARPVPTIGTLRWAEAGYVPWHRICDVCGSHFDLHPVTYYRTTAGAWLGTNERGVLTPVEHLGDLRDADGVLVDATHARLLDLAAVHDGESSWANAADFGIVSIASACWITRARFYR